MLAAQIVAVLIFVVMFVLIITEKIERQWVTLGCALAVLVIVSLISSSVENKSIYLYCPPYLTQKET